MALRLPITPGRYILRNGTKARVDSVTDVKASDGSLIGHAWGEEIVGGQMRMWDAATGKRMPTSAPGAKKQDIVRRGR